MNSEILRIVDAIYRDKNIAKEIVFEGIEAALLAAAKKHYPDAEEIAIHIDRESGTVQATKDGAVLDPVDFGRIAAQTAKQVMIAKIREAEQNSIYEDYIDQKGQLVIGTVQRFEGGAVTVNLGKAEALLPRSEQIPGESHHPGERVRAVVIDVRRSGPRVKIILSRTHPDFVRRLFELEIPEIGERIIDIRALAREAGYRSKVAVSSIDSKVDCVGACVGVRGTRIKNIIDELGGERIDIVRWNESLQVLIPYALQPAEVEEVMLCPMLGRAIVLVREDQLSLAIGRRGQNVRLASKLTGWDIEIMTKEELDEQIERAVTWFSAIPGIDSDLVDRLIEEGFLSFDDLSIMEPEDLATIEGLSEDRAYEIISAAEEQSRLMESEGEGGRVRKAGRPAPEAATAEADVSGPAPGPGRSGKTTAADLFPETRDEPRDSAEPTAESVFGTIADAPESGTAVPDPGEEPASALSPAPARTEEPAPDQGG